MLISEQILETDYPIVFRLEKASVRKLVGKLRQIHIFVQFTISSPRPSMTSGMFIYSSSFRISAAKICVGWCIYSSDMILLERRFRMRVRRLDIHIFEHAIEGSSAPRTIGVDAPWEGRRIRHRVVQVRP